MSDPLKGDWQRHVLASSGYLELGMFDDAAMALEEIAPEDKSRNEVEPEKSLVEKFSRAYAAASPDEQAALRVWMRDIILPLRDCCGLPSQVAIAAAMSHFLAAM